MIKVFIVKGPEQGRSFVLSNSEATLGRDSENEICLNESSVSRKHAKIYKDKDLYYLEDLQSKNGTWVNGSVIENGVRVPVQEGVPIAIGNILVSVGKKCSLDRLPNQYSISIQPPIDSGPKPSAFIDRRSKQERELELISEISIKVLGSLDLNEVCREALESVVALLKRIDSGFVFVIDPENRCDKAETSRRIELKEPAWITLSGKLN